MSQIQNIIVIGSAIILITLGILLPMSVIASGNVLKKFSKSNRTAILYYLLVIGTVLNVALSDRSLYTEAEIEKNPFLALQSASSWGEMSSRIISFICIIICAAELFNWVIDRNKLKHEVKIILLLLIQFFLLQNIFSGIFGTYRHPQLNHLYFLIYAIVLLILSDGFDKKLWVNLRYILIVPSLGSLLSIFVAPRMALLYDYEAFIPGLDFRLFGIADHANSLGTIAAAAILIEFSPAIKKYPNFIILTTHIATLILSQSKTAWLGTIVSLIIIRWDWIKNILSNGDNWKATLIMTSYVISIATIFTTILFYTSQSSGIQQQLDANGVFTLTGRTKIWLITYQEFLKNPIFGYGPSLWDIEYRTERKMLYVGQAHNQFLQTLGQAGIIGIISMFAYLFTIIMSLIKNKNELKSLAISLFILIIFRCISESPLRMTGLLSWDNWIHITLVMSVIGINSTKENNVDFDT